MDFIKFIESNQKIFIVLLWLFLVTSLACTFTMIVILIKRGDERKKYIVSKSGLSALLAGIVLLIANIIWNIFFEQNSRIGFESNPAIYLGVMSIVFNISYLIIAKKYR